ncbi:glycosyltransferase family 87 protein [Vibrio sp. B1Z05]|uniref:glycosyltransferase family 87 protein n=1 Tax=Vibrio sp. B1Z05 TaxID=2654980 RepID=UPI00128D0180|nr:glycosyltransferase family 87 protein [Vibrio sp. B1Z05]MPW34910.1 DUF2029 domain-containing protein [Vibrio sp. B1Z05]
MTDENIDYKVFFLFFFILGLIITLNFLYIDNIDFISGELSRGQIFGRDFLHSWTAAKLAVNNHLPDVYNHTLFPNHAPDEVRATGVAFNFAYPPQMLSILYPLGFLSYESAFIIWSLLSFSCFLLSVTLGSSYNKIYILVLMLAPATLINISFGQNGLLTAALLIGGCKALNRSHILSGILFGILTIKPHMGILIPFALIAGRYWKTFIWATLTAIIMVAFSCFILSYEVWYYWMINSPWKYAKNFIEHGVGLGINMQISPFISARLLTGSIYFAWIVQVICCLIAILSTIYAFIKSDCWLIKVAVLVTATYLSSPYIHSYDMSALSVIIVLLISSDKICSFNKLERYLMVFIWVTPILTMRFSIIGFPYAPVLTLLFLCMLIRTIRKNN